MGQNQEFRHIVRIINKDLDGNKNIINALRAIKGVGHRFARIAAYTFEKETGIKANTKLGSVPEEYDKKIEDILLNPQNYAIPAWVFNRRKDFVSGEDKHLIMGDLDFSIREDIKRMERNKSYKGIRHALGLPVRGQRTKTGFRKRGVIIGVVKSEQKK